MPKYDKMVFSDHCKERQAERDITHQQKLKEIDAIYIKIKSGKVSKSKEIGPNGEGIIDLDKDGNVIGIEMLAPGQITVRMFNKIKKQYHIQGLDHLKIDRLQEAFV